MRDLVGDQHALVDDGLRRQARRVERIGGVQAQAVDGVLDAAANDVELAFESALRAGAGARSGVLPDEHLPDDRLAPARGGSQPAAVGGDVPPAQQGLALFVDDAGDQLFDPPPFVRPSWQKKHARAVLPLRGRVNPSAAVSRRRNRSGIWSSSPAPSPVSGSHPQAPRWSRLTRSREPDRRACASAAPGCGTTNPTPQESCSNRGIVEPLAPTRAAVVSRIHSWVRSLRSCSSPGPRSAALRCRLSRSVRGPAAPGARAGASAAEQLMNSVTAGSAVDCFDARC